MVRIISALILAVTATCATAQEPPKLVDNPPDHYTVVKGDTLWGISGRFLQEPWRWPEIWRMNKEQIKNPHLIYPGDVVYLDYSDGKARLRLGKRIGGSNMGRDEKAQPQVYSSPVEDSIPSIPANAIEPYLSQPLIYDTENEANSRPIAAMQEDRLAAGLADTVYVAGISQLPQEKWQVFRPGKPLKDPETGETIAYEAYFLGNAKTLRRTEPSELSITLAKEEIVRGDRVLPAPTPRMINYVPHRFESPLDARVVSVYGGLTEGGLHSIISINRGSAIGLETGHVLALYRHRVAKDIDESGKRSVIEIPDERYALAFVFRTFDRIAYALVVRAAKPVLIGDTVTNP